MKICRVFKFAEHILSYIFFSIVIGHFIFLFFFLCGRGGVSSDYFIIFLLNNLLRVTNFAIRCVFESARLVPENRTVSVFASHHNSSQEKLKFSSSLTTRKTKMKKLLASMPSIRNTSHVRGMVCFISLCFQTSFFPWVFLLWKRKTWDWHNSTVSGFWFTTISSICSVFSRNTSGWCSRRLISVDKACFFF